GRTRCMYVHRLVAAAFHGPAPFPGACVAHNDGNKLNNRASNLRWASRSSNERDKWQHGRMSNGERHGNAKFPDVTIERARSLRARGLTASEISRITGVSSSH